MYKSKLKSKHKPNAPRPFIERILLGQTFVFEAPDSLEVCQGLLQTFCDKSALECLMYRVDSDHVQFCIEPRGGKSTSVSPMKSTGTLIRVGDHTSIRGKTTIPLLNHVAAVLFALFGLLVGGLAIYEKWWWLIIVAGLWVLIFGASPLLVGDTVMRRFHRQLRRALKSKRPQADAPAIKPSTVPLPNCKKTLWGQTFIFDVPYGIEACRTRIEQRFNDELTLEGMVSLTSSSKATFEIDYYSNASLEPFLLAKLTGILTQREKGTRVAAYVHLPLSVVLPPIIMVFILLGVAVAMDLVIGRALNSLPLIVMNFITIPLVLVCAFGLLYIFGQNVQQKLGGALYETLSKKDNTITGASILHEFESE